jgi:hypothetical protein
VKPRKPMKRVSDKRRKQNAEYLKVRSAYLKEHPYCEVWLAENNLTKEQVDAENGYAEILVSCQAGCLTEPRMVKVPRSTEIHHKKGRVGALLCNTEHFMAVCRANHQILHARPSKAREKGFIL